MNYTKQQILDVVNNQLLLWIKKDEAVKNAVFELVQTKYPTRKEMDDKFEKMLTLFRQELANDREAQEKKWDAQEKKWDAQEKKWDEQKAEDKKAWNDWFIRYEADRAEDKKKWEADRAEDRKKYEADRAEDRKKWEADRAEDKKKWEEHQSVIEKMLDRLDKHDAILNKMLANIDDLNTKYIVNLGAIGQRWGMASEASFRNALKAILEKSFPVKVINYNKMDTECLVYEKPTPVEIDVIIYNGITILCEIKASVSRGDVYDFVKKIHYYEKKENVEVTRKIIISPMIDPDAKQEVEYYGMEVYSTPKEIKLMD